MKTLSLATFALASALAASPLPAAPAADSAPAAATATPAPARTTTSPDVIDRTQKPAAGPLPAIAFPDAVSETLPNGLRLYVLQDHRQPTITFRLLIKSGALFDGSKPGLAGITASMLNKGTDTMTADQFAAQTDFLGSSVEAAASEDALSVTAIGLAKYTRQVLQFLRDAALHPAFSEEELKQEQLQTVAGLVQSKSSPKALALHMRNRLLYGEHPYGAFATPESVQSITRDDLVKFHDAHFLPNNATLIVVGDIEPEKAIAQVKEMFGDWKKGEVPALLDPKIPHNETGRFLLPAFPKINGMSIHLVDRHGSVQSDVVVASAGVPRNNPDTPELGVVNSVLGGGFSGRLFANLREKHAFTYGSYSSFSEQMLGGTFGATAEVRNAVTGAAITEILNELNRIDNEPIPESELMLQRNYLVGNFLLSMENDLRIAERLQEIDLFGLPDDFYKTYAKRLSEVTPEKASELAKKYIDPKNVVVVVVGEAKEVLPQLTKLGSVTVYDTDLKKVSEAPQQAASDEKPVAKAAATPEAKK